MENLENDLVDTPKNQNNLEQKISDFLKQYYRNPASKRSGEVDKNNLFGRFYYELIRAMYESLKIEINKVPRIDNVIEVLACHLHEWDDLVEKNEAIETARTTIYTDFLKEKQIKIIKDNLKIEFDIDELENALDAVEKYFKSEKVILENKETNETIESMLEKGNCDFYFYNEILFKYILMSFGEKAKTIIENCNRFLNTYLKIDLLLDHITDIEEDLKGDNFNILLWRLKQFGIKVDDITNVYSRLEQQNIYKEFYQIAENLFEQANDSLENMKKYGPLHNLLQYYLNGAAEGLYLFMKYNCLLDFSEEKRRDYILAILKPHPWERLSKNKLKELGLIKETPINLMVQTKKINDIIKHQNKVIIPLGGRCEYGECAHCGLGSAVVEDTDFDQFKKQLETIDTSVIDTICIYTAGSFFKFNSNYREKILCDIASSNIMRVIIESRPELIIEENLKQLRDIVGKKDIWIGIGLDHKSYVYRNIFLNKNISLDDYEKAILLAKNSGFKTVTYVAVGCPFLAEKEAIDSAIETAHHAIDIGTDIVSLEPLEMQQNTIQHILQQEGRWEPPFLWSMIEVIKNINSHAKEKAAMIIVGGSVQVPIPAEYPYNRCSICDEDGRVINALEQYEKTQDIDTVKNIECACKSKWHSILSYD